MLARTKAIIRSLPPPQIPVLSLFASVPGKAVGQKTPVFILFRASLSSLLWVSYRILHLSLLMPFTVSLRPQGTGYFLFMQQPFAYLKFVIVPLQSPLLL